MGKDADGVLRQGGCIEKRSRALLACARPASRNIAAPDGSESKLTLTIN